MVEIAYKSYFRKSSFKKDIKNGERLLSLINFHKPKNVLEIGVLEGATSRNMCKLLHKIHKNNFSYIGIDLFGLDRLFNNNKEFTPLSNKFSNPIKYIYFKYILKLEPNSKKAVQHLLKKYSQFIRLYQGYSDVLLEELNLSNIDFVFLDGGHSYETVKQDLSIILRKIKKKSIIICDDYNILHYGVKKAVDEVKHNYYFEDLGRFAFLKI